LSEAFNALGFNPEINGSSFFVVTADVHFGQKGINGMLLTINEVNKIIPYPNFLAVTGDLIRSGSRHFGVVPDIEERQAAINEFKAFKKDMELLDPNIRPVLSLGNHDTHPKEVDPEMFWEVFPDYPPYQSFDLSKIHIIVLNGHSTGYIDSKQLEWLSNDVKKISKDQTIIILIHQPAMSFRVRERGIPKAVSEVFQDHRGKIWMIAGHEHYNAQKVIQLKKTKLIEHTITRGGDTANIVPEKSGYWIYCLANGDITGRIYRDRYEGYRIEVSPDLKHALKVPVPFDHTKKIIWRVLVGEGDRTFLVDSKAWDCLNYWAYVKELTYRIPLKETNNHGKRIALLCNYNEKILYQDGQYFISSDLMNWHEMTLEDAKFNVMYFVIPKIFHQVENVYFKYIPAGEVHVGGFALLR